MVGGGPVGVLNPDLNSLGHFATEYVYTIPNYQRGFSWGSDQWNDLWTDIIETPPGLSHYFGSCVVRSTGHVELAAAAPLHRGEAILIDGQQRMTAVFLLLRAIREHIHIVDPMHALNSQIDRNLFFVLNAGGRRTILKNNNPEFQNCFESLVYTGHFGGPITNRPQRRMMEAYGEYRLLIQGELDLLGTPNEKKDFLADIFSRIVTGLKLTLVPLTSDMEPALVFEAINNRGIPLSSLDRVKNLIMLIDSRMGRRAEKYSTEAENVVIAYGGAPRPGAVLANVAAIKAAGSPSHAAMSANTQAKEVIDAGGPKIDAENFAQTTLDAQHAVNEGLGFEETWFEVITLMDHYGLSNSEEEDKMLAHYWCMFETGGRFYPKEVYTHIHSLFWCLTTTENEGIERKLRRFADGLLDATKAYCEFFVENDHAQFGSFTRWPGIGASRKESLKLLLKDFRAVGLPTMMSTLSLAVYLKVGTAAEYEKYLKNLGRCMFRVYRVAGKRSNDYLNDHGNTARDLYNGNPPTPGMTAIDHSMHYLCGFTMTHCTLLQMQHILNNRGDIYNMQKGSVARHFLFMFERSLYPAAIPPISYWDFNVNTNIEHILPQDTSRHYWRNRGGQPRRRFTEDELIAQHPDGLIHNLGNLVLSQQNANATYSNHGYNIKRVKYNVAGADLLRVNEIGRNYSEWRNECVHHRRKMMINFAVNDDGTGNGRWKMDCDNDAVPLPLPVDDCDWYEEVAAALPNVVQNGEEE